MHKLVSEYVELPIAIRRPLWRLWHTMINRMDHQHEAIFMNYGYHHTNGEAHIALEPHDEINRYCIQLYDHVVSEGDILDRKVLEVGSGRGGGAHYIARYYKPESYIGLDISAEVIKFCNRYYKVPNLTFRRGVAEDLPFEDNSFDAVVNVESARCYRSIPKFFSEVKRVLKPGGQFLFADMIKQNEEAEIRQQLGESGMRIIRERNISPNVVEALNRDHERRMYLVRKTPGFLQKAFSEFAGAKGTQRYESFADGSIGYWSYVLVRD